MKIKLILSFLFLLVTIFCQAGSPAAEIKMIQKNHVEYINAESTAPSENEARANAIGQIFEIARNFVETNNEGASISDKDITAALKEIIMPRGDFKRVFVYAARADLLAASTKDGKVETPAPVKTTGLSSKIPSIPKKDTPVAEEPDVNETSDSHRCADDTSASETATEKEDEIYIPAPIAKKVVKQSMTASGALGKMIEEIQQCNTLVEATNLLQRNKDRFVITNFDIARKCTNSSASFWIVEDNGVISVLGPEINGFRKNYRTNEADALHRYSNGLWFRTRK